MNDRQRTVLAILLMVGVALIPSLIRSNAQPPAPSTPDQVAMDLPEPPSSPDPAPEPTAPPPAEVLPEVFSTPEDPDARDPGRPVVVTSPIYSYTFSERGARLIGASLTQYKSLRPADGDSVDVQIIPENSLFLRYQLVFGSDTVSLADWEFEPSKQNVSVGADGAELTWTASRGSARVRLTYTFAPDRYVFDIRGELSGLPGGNAPLLLIGLGPQLRSAEADSVEDQRALGVVTKDNRTENHKFSSVGVGEVQPLNGPFEWVAIKSKYFLTVLLAVEDNEPRFGGATLLGGPQTSRTENNVAVNVALAVPTSTFQMSMYVGPQENRRLQAIGHDLTDVNPYGWIFRPIIGPISQVIVRVLVWGRENLKLSYGVLLILFGVGIRILIWPLNQKAMRSQMSMQALQPEMEALKRKYKNDPQKMQQETMKLYKEHGANPLGGCLPMLLPMPILFAFFFVFMNTIELRGVAFAWLPDLSRPDPLYIIPVMLGLSMFLSSKLGQRGLPPNPQTKMMLYIMPLVLTFLFLRFASGLNLYYASQNFASVPQQWLLAKERLRRSQGAPKKT